MECILFGSRHKLNPKLAGFHKKETPSSTYIQAILTKKETGEMYIMFRGGKTFYYKNVSPEVIEGALTADSIGKFYHAFINKHIEATEEKETLFTPITE